MLHPPELLDLARQLAAARANPPPTEAQLRRAVSTAYYALFHTVVQAGARRLIGRDHEGEAGYALLYRDYDHNRMKVVCKDLTASPLAEKTQRRLGRQRVGQDLQDFAWAFIALQDARHRADYHPQGVWAHAAAIELVNRADLAMQVFNRVPGKEQEDVLALLLVNPRD